MRFTLVIETNTNRNLVTGLAALISVVLWASAFVGIRASLADYGPYHLALFRWLASSLVFLLLAVVKPVRVPARVHLPAIALTGLFGIAGYSVLLNLGEMTVTASAASFIVNTVPIQTAILAAFLLRDKITRRLLVSMLTGLLGVGLITFGEKSAVYLINTGALLILFAAFSQALYFIGQKKLLKYYTPLEVVSYTAFAGTLILLFFCSRTRKYHHVGIWWSHHFRTLYRRISRRYRLSALDLRPFQNAGCKGYSIPLPGALCSHHNLLFLAIRGTSSEISRRWHRCLIRTCLPVIW